MFEKVYFVSNVNTPRADAGFTAALHAMESEDDLASMNTP